MYQKAEIYLNGEKLAFRPYGYIGFAVDASAHIKCGETNELKVIARNGEQPNSRWYTGSGIYRDVNLYVADKRHIAFSGVKITTLSLSPAKVKVEVKTSDDSPAHVEIFSASGEIVAVGDTNGGEIILDIPVPELWSPASPYLYRLEAS